MHGLKFTDWFKSYGRNRGVCVLGGGGGGGGGGGAVEGKREEGESASSIKFKGSHNGKL